MLEGWENPYLTFSFFREPEFDGFAANQEGYAPQPDIPKKE